MKITIAHLYPKQMNLYGDTGNVLILKKRLEWRGIDVSVLSVDIGQKIPDHVDIVFGGGGQDASQGEIEKDFISKGPSLKKLADDGCVMLMICGLYQLMGKKFITYEGEEILGIGLLPVTTYGKKKRLIGNITINIDNIGDVVGYENHSGQTFLEDQAISLATVIRGVGNNQSSSSEGCRYKNVFATYLHGPVLAKSPELADHLIDLAVNRKHPNTKLKSLDDELEIKTRSLAILRPR